MKNIEELQQIIGYHFKDLQLLVTALTHSSYLNESKGRDSLPADNERLEFFGDAIIEFYVSDYLFHKYDDTPEGDMTKLRASMVCEQSLAECSRQIGLGSYLNMGKGEESSGGRERPSITSDAFEALTAAIYLDSGKEAAEAFIREHLIKVLEHKTLFFDAKTRLQEIIQKDPGAKLTYELLSEEGPSHNKVFTSAVLLNGREIGRGSGHSKKLSQQEAAVHAMETISQEEI
ncbi:MAG: ribonuclease III [Parasporobacterium sp.]|nr:ribonuclease III [Parasporobacterium sp.]